MLCPKSEGPALRPYLKPVKMPRVKKKGRGGKGGNIKKK